MITHGRCHVLFLLSMIGLLLPASLRSEPPLPQIQRLKTSPVLQHLVPNHAPFLIETAAQQTLSRMYVPEGFQVDLVASEPGLVQPVAFTFDARGRIWVAEALSYPTKRPDGQGLDRILILTDKDGDGAFETRKVFIEGLNLVSGLEVGHGGIWVGAAPELLFIPDRDLDDQPDGPPEVRLNGFGYQDTHETLNSFIWGPDGWLYGIQGVFNTARIGTPETAVEDRPELRAGVWRYHPARRTFEIFANGGSNPWGLDYDEDGQFFMTHCRSYWGRGPTTHVIQGGQFWNQVNANYAPFIIANPPDAYPEWRNYLLASARYGHGAGGAGEQGSDAIYGGHSHVGTMIYLGDNWPDAYRGHLFTHNLGGHQINQQINHPMGSGYNTVHAGQDVLFCTDPRYVAVNLKYGPDGAVYFIDWVDDQHCHNPNTERWDRKTGRLYRMQWQANYHPVQVDLYKKKDLELVSLLDQKNRWYARMARLLLNERSANGDLSRTVPLRLRELLGSQEPKERLNALWTLFQIGGLKDRETLPALADPDPFVRGWAAQLVTEQPGASAAVRSELVRLSADDPSPVVRRYLASALPRVNTKTGWEMAAALARHGEDAADRNLPFLLWHGIAGLWLQDPDPAGGSAYKKALAIARDTDLPQLTDWIYWFAATLEGDALNQAVNSLNELRDDALLRRLTGLWLAMEPRANVPMPATWKKTATVLLHDTHPEVRRLTQRLGAVYGDDASFAQLRQTLVQSGFPADERKHAFDVLSRALDPESLKVFLGLLDDADFRLQTLRLLGRYSSPAIPKSILDRFNSLSPAEQSAALETLAGRATYARPLLEAILAKKLRSNLLTAYHIRQLSNLNDPAVNQLLTDIYGPIKTTPDEKQRQIAALETAFNEAPLWAYSANAGQQLFQTLCAACHRIGNVGGRLGPELTGAGKHGVRYFLENVIDPDAVIGRDFQMTTLETNDGNVLTGLVVAETAGAVTLNNTSGPVIVPVADIKQRVLSEKSMMPEGLLEALNDRERIELLKFLTGN